MEKNDFKDQIKDLLYQKSQHVAQEKEQGHKFDNPLKGNNDVETEQRKN